MFLRPVPFSSSIGFKQICGVFFLDRVLFSLTGGVRLAIRPVNALRAARGD